MCLSLTHVRACVRTRVCRVCVLRVCAVYHDVVGGADTLGAREAEPLEVRQSRVRRTL